MAAEAEAAREARAKVIAAEGEHKSSRALAQAAEVIAESPAALQVCHFKSSHISQFLLLALFSGWHIQVCSMMLESAWKKSNRVNLFTRSAGFFNISSTSSEQVKKGG